MMLELRSTSWSYSYGCIEGSFDLAAEKFVLPKARYELIFSSSFLLLLLLLFLFLLLLHFISLMSDSLILPADIIDNK